ncbi:glycine zipper 2TM domain-containing protein [Zooshikella harenae]|uniref:Glycine zipper 2TM domain-containing protein n=1 Tax=Zooshikella harenae TaxID=2827238 RepID=A0ABS5Z985_9GAMM|nr:glycine zipper 2TM domain-containing protein [Zooshikella harenae]MBU2710612.1 glycine zipper 2TM domain-containing protein [Zooshikella harenae]
MKKVLISSFLCVAMVVSSGCSTQGNKQEIGTAVGAVLGAVVGSALGKGRGKKVAIAAGAVLGGYIGNQLGAYLDEQDRIALEQKSISVLNTAKDGEDVQWRSQRTGAEATISTRNSRKETRNVNYYRDKRVVKVMNLTLIGKTFQAKQRSNVRNAPEKQGYRVTSLAAGEQVTAVGKTPSNWVMIAKKGVTIGYVHGSLLKPVAVQEKQTVLKTAKTNENSNQQPKSINIDDIELKDVDVVEDSMAVNTECRSLDMKINNKGKSGNESFDTCKGADGAWEII